MKPILTLLGLLVAFKFAAPDASAQTASAYKNYIDTAKTQIDQNNLEIERIKLMQAEYRAHRNEAAAKSKDAEIKRYQNINILKQQEISMYQPCLSGLLTKANF